MIRLSDFVLRRSASIWNLIFLAALALPVWSQQSVRYDLRFPNAVHHEAEVRATFTGITDPVLHVVMSCSSPGRYALHEFAKNIYNIRASEGDGKSAMVAHPDASSWDVSARSGTVIFEYTLFGDRSDGTYAAIDATHAHLNMAAALVWAHGFENAASTLKFEMPEGSNWTVATQLIPRENGTWSAPNLEWLMDSPVEISVHQTAEWKVENATFRLAIHQRGTRFLWPAVLLSRHRRLLRAYRPLDELTNRLRRPSLRSPEDL